MWEPFGEDHVHYVPFASLTPVEADNIVAAVHDIDIAALRRRVAANVDA